MTASGEANARRPTAPATAVPMAPAGQPSPALSPLDAGAAEEAIDLSELTRDPDIGTILRRQRLLTGHTQTAVAHALHLTPQSLHLYETTRRQPPPKLLRAWCDAVQLPDWQRHVVASVAAGGLLRPSPGDRPAHRTTQNSTLNALTVPAWLIDSVFDVAVTNPAAAQLFPCLRVDARRGPVNLMEWLLYDLQVRAALENWHEIVHWVVAQFRVYAPGSPRALAVARTCHTHPIFARLWHRTLTDEQYTGTTPRMRGRHGTARLGLLQDVGGHHALLVLAP